MTDDIDPDVREALADPEVRAILAAAGAADAVRRAELLAQLQAAMPPVGATIAKLGWPRLLERMAVALASSRDHVIARMVMAGGENTYIEPAELRTLAVNLTTAVDYIDLLTGLSRLNPDAFNIKDA